MQRINGYCFNREEIKKKKLWAWEKTVKKMRSKDPRAKSMPCPYLFLEKEEIPRHEAWINLLEVLR